MVLLVQKVVKVALGCPVLLLAPFGPGPTLPLWSRASTGGLLTFGEVLEGEDARRVVTVVIGRCRGRLLGVRRT
jgi:hypothetical protein